MLTDQWYVNAKELAKDAIKAMDAGHATNNSAYPNPPPSAHPRRRRGTSRKFKLAPRLRGDERRERNNPFHPRQLEKNLGSMDEQH